MIARLWIVDGQIVGPRCPGRKDGGVGVREGGKRPNGPRSPQEAEMALEGINGDKA